MKFQLRTVLLVIMLILSIILLGSFFSKGFAIEGFRRHPGQGSQDSASPGPPTQTPEPTQTPGPTPTKIKINVISLDEMRNTVISNLGYTVSYSDPSYNITNLSLVFDSAILEQNYDAISKTDPTPAKDQTYSDFILKTTEKMNTSNGIGSCGVYYKDQNPKPSPIGTNEPGPTANLTLQPSSVSMVAQNFGRNPVGTITRERPENPPKSMLYLPVIYKINGTDTVYYFVFDSTRSQQAVAGDTVPYVANTTTVTPMPLAPNTSPPPLPTLGMTNQYLTGNGNY
jgi:hypothetical protein